MLRELVRLNAEGRFSEVDAVRVKRKAQALRDYIVTQVPAGDPWAVHSDLLPLVDDVLAGRITLPLTFEDLPGKTRRCSREGELPDALHKVYSGFVVAATGERLGNPPVEVIDGVRHAWLDREEPGDFEKGLAKFP